MGFDTSAAHCAAALLSGDRILAEAHEDMAKGQAERLIPLIEDTLAAGGACPGDLTAIGVGIGPGNFTGIRISVSAARGLALALGIPAVGVSRLDALALDAPRPTLACIDARRDSVYLQRFGDEADRGPAWVPLAEVMEWAMPDLTVTGHKDAEIAEWLGVRHTPPAASPAPAIARLAARRHQAPGLPRPAPLYIRPADAAPSRERGPVILPA
ncbi:tRNA (adenosine(37)-N6)-threonylcarbamoyltransferase complex dimerization subunit type 1 TsaB [Roseicyclus elongatus]|uniref:tRNA (adenosine(37)-N6)-threonylcarbamoyltransferase complex dimerization subunit type 1 TsaB n=1 Tax=Roseicyclus elongatus TaxID=159346 RepID=UPI00316ACE39